MCNDCFSHNLNRRDFMRGSIKASGFLSLAMAAGMPVMGPDFFSDRNTHNRLFEGEWAKIKKEPAKILAVFLYPPADVVNEGKNEDSWAQHHWFTWPGNQFEPERQEKLFASKIRSIADNLGMLVDFAPKAIYQQTKVEEFITKAKAEQPDAVLVVNFWNTFKNWSFKIANESAPAAIVYQPVGSNHQLPMPELMNTKGIFYIHSIENWDEIERGLLAVHAKKMLGQSRLLRISDQKEVTRGIEEFLNVDILGIPADEFNLVFDSVKPDNKILKEANRFKRNAKLVMHVEDSYIVEAIRSHHAVAQIMERYGADAITIQCLMLKHRKPCVSFSINNGNLIPCGCENHLDGVLTQMVGRWLFERAGFMHNPEFDTSENLYFGSHCTCATKLQGPKGPDQEFLIRPFFHQLPNTAALDVQWTPKDPVMLTKYHSGENKISCWTGKVVSSPKSPPTGGCATRVLVDIDKAEDIRDVYLGTHPILFWGNRSDARKVKVFSQLYGLDLGGNI
jgi:hypothetical protein